MVPSNRTKAPNPASQARTWRGVTILLSSLALIASAFVFANATAAPDASRKAARVPAVLSPDLILYNGKISTLDDGNSTVAAIAIRDGEILATGSNAAMRALAGKRSKLIDLKGKRVLPGLIDGHIHGMRTAYHCWTQTVRLDQVTTRAAALDTYADKAAELPDDRWIWTTFGGWNINQLDDPTVFTFDELSEASPDNPLWVTGAGFTGTRVNQAALDALDLEPGDPGVEVDGENHPTGLITAPATTAANAAITAQLNELGIEGEAACLSDFLDEAVSRGMTSFKDAGGNTFPWATTGAISDGLHVEEAAGWLYRTEGLKVRIAYHQMSSYAGANRAIEDLRNAVGFVGDDKFRYLGPGEDVMATDPNFQAFVELAARKRVSVETHVGNLNAILDGYEAANAVFPIADLGWRIAHPADAEPTDEQIARAKAMGVGFILTFSTVKNGEPGPRFKSTLDSGAKMCLAADAMNVAPWMPFQNLWYVTTGQTLIPGNDGVPPEERLTRLEALRLATVDCAWTLDQEGDLGSLEKGNLADLIVLNKDYFTVPDEGIRSIRSLLTVVDGEIVHTSGKFAGVAQ